MIGGESAQFRLRGAADVDLGRSNYVISFGADFLGTWNSPVAQSIGYGEMRQGRPGQRGKVRAGRVAHVADRRECRRMDSCPPGTEGVLALGLAHVILSEKLRPAARAAHAGSLIDGWAAGPARLRAGKGREADRRPRRRRSPESPAKLRRTLRPSRSSAMRPSAHTNGLFNALAVNALNALLGSVGQAGRNLVHAGNRRVQSPLARQRKRPAQLRFRIWQRIDPSADAVKVLAALRRESRVSPLRRAWRRCARRSRKFRSSRASAASSTKRARSRI